MLPIAQADCKMEDTSTKAAPTQRQLGVYDGDSRIDLALAPRSFLAVRPLTDDEIVVCRSFSLQTLTATRQPAAWALAEATAPTSENHHILVSDLDFTNSRVWIHGRLQGGASVGFAQQLGSCPPRAAGGQPRQRAHRRSGGCL